VNLLTRINKEVFNALLKKTGKSESRIYQIIQEKRKEYDYTISNKTAVNLLAAQMKIDVSKYLKKEEIDELRTLRKTQAATIPLMKAKQTNRKTTPTVSIKFGERLLQNFLLPKNLANEAKRMADVYPMLYLLENALRYFIMSVLKENYGEKWWEQRVSLSINRKVSKRLNKEGKNRWHSQRGSDRIFYTDFGDLHLIITKDWDEFKEFFPNQEWIKARLDDIELSRNIIAHNNPLPSKEIQRFKLYFEDIRKQLSKTNLN